MNYYPLAPFFKGEFGVSISLYQEGCLSGTGYVKKVAKMGHHVGYLTVETMYCRLAILKKNYALSEIPDYHFPEVGKVFPHFSYSGWFKTAVHHAVRTAWIFSCSVF